jgi:hypothetical protein
MKRIKLFKDIVFYKATDSYFLELVKKNGTIKGLHGNVITEIWDFAIEVNRVCCKFFKENSMSDSHLDGTDFMKFNKIVMRYLAGENSYNQRIHPGASVTTTMAAALDFAKKLLLSDVLNQALDLCIRGYTSIDGLRHLKKNLKHTSNSFPVVLKIRVMSPDMIVAAEGEKIKPEMLLAHFKSLDKDDPVPHDYLLTADPGLENIEFMAEKNGKFETCSLDDLILMHDEMNRKG